MSRKKEATKEDSVEYLTKVLNSVEASLRRIHKCLAKYEGEQEPFSIIFYRNEMEMAKRTILTFKRAIEAIREEPT